MLRFNQLLILIEFCFSNYPVSLLLVSFPYKNVWYLTLYVPIYPCLLFVLKFHSDIFT